MEWHVNERDSKLCNASEQKLGRPHRKLPFKVFGFYISSLPIHHLQTWNATLNGIRRERYHPKLLLISTLLKDLDNEVEHSNYLHH